MFDFSLRCWSVDAGRRDSLLRLRLRGPTLLVAVASLGAIAAATVLPAASLAGSASEADSIAQRFAEEDEAERLRRYEDEMLARARAEARERAEQERARREAEARSEAERYTSAHSRKKPDVDQQNAVRQKEADELSARLRAAREQHRAKELAEQRAAAIEAARDRLRERVEHLRRRVAEAESRRKEAERLAPPRYVATSHRDSEPRVYRPLPSTNAARPGALIEPPRYEAPQPAVADDGRTDDDFRDRDEARDEWRGPLPGDQEASRLGRNVSDEDDDRHAAADVREPYGHFDRGANRGHVTVLLIMKPGTGGIRRWNKTADPMLCVDTSCYISRGSDEAAEQMTRSHGFGPTIALGKRAGACRNKLACVFRDVEVTGPRGWMQPVDLRIVRHDRREARMIEPDSTCFVDRDELHCARPVITDGYTAWVIPEIVAIRAGAAALEEALADGLEPARSAHAARH